MCQNETTARTYQVYGHIVTTPCGFLVFSSILIPGYYLISQHVELHKFIQFVKYLKSFGLLEGAKLRCCEVTVLEAYQEFTINQLLKSNGISKLPLEAPEVNVLNTAAVNSKFNFWLEKARRFFHFGGFSISSTRTNK